LNGILHISTLPESLGEFDDIAPGASCTIKDDFLCFIASGPLQGRQGVLARLNKAYRVDIGPLAVTINSEHLSETKPPNAD
jgi:hypothetical protein